MMSLGEANSNGVPPDKKVNNAEYLTYISTNIDALDNFTLVHHNLRTKRLSIGKI
jgi:hypothetical protein